MNETNNEQSRLDAAVEVALTAYYGEVDWTRNLNSESMRAALLAALPVLLGEPVAWQRRIRADGGRWSDWAEWEDLDGEGQRPKIGRWDAEYRPVYAPDLGCGK